MTRAEFIKNLGLFGTLLTVLGYKEALAIKPNDKINVTNTTIFDLEFFSDSYGKRHGCERLVNQINDYFRSNKRPNFQQIVESGKYFQEEFSTLNRLMGKIGRGTSNLSKIEQEDRIQDYLSVCILTGKCKILLGDARNASSIFFNVEHMGICMSKLNIGKKGNLYPKGLNDRFYALANKEIAEAYLKTDFMHTDATFHYKNIFEPNEICSNKKNCISLISEKELKRIKIVLNELQLRPYLFHNDNIINDIKSNIEKYNDITKPFVRRKRKK
jgi:hypothetical protein